MGPKCLELAPGKKWDSVNICRVNEIINGKISGCHVNNGARWRFGRKEPFRKSTRQLYVELFENGGVGKQGNQIMK